MTPATEVIACPACRHIVRIPEEWLGTQVQCPECRASFIAPMRDGDRLTEPVLVSQPDANPAATRSAPDRGLWLAAFGLMLLGVVSLGSNSATLYAIATDRARFEAEKKEQAAELAEKMGQDRKAIGEDHPAANWPVLLGVTIWSVVCGIASIAGGAAIALRRGRRVAQVGSALAVLNFAGLCCLPGAFVGGWSWLRLGTAEGRAHFAP